MKEEILFICKCGKHFNTGRSLQSHESQCKEYKQWKLLHNQELLQQKEAKRLPNGMFKCENPKCNKEHDGSYGTGRFCSNSCRRSYAAQQNDCIKIGKKRRSRKQMNMHEKHLKTRSPYGRWQCKRCNLIFETRAQLFEHNHQVHPIQKGSSWNKGLTKETDSRVAVNAKHASESFKNHINDGYINPTWTNEYWTEERRKERSIQKKKLYAEHPEKHPNRKVARNRKHMTYPERLIFDWLTQQKIEFEHSYKCIYGDNNVRYVDFYIPSKKLFAEVDGVYWHKDRKENDAFKDSEAMKIGIKTIRLTPSKKMLLEFIEQFQKIK